MTLDQLVGWGFPASVGALAAVIWWLARRLWERLDAQDANSDRIEKMIATDLRAMDVRISVIEGFLWPPGSGARPGR